MSANIVQIKRTLANSIVIPNHLFFPIAELAEILHPCDVKELLAVFVIDFSRTRLGTVEVVTATPFGKVSREVLDELRKIGTFIDSSNMFSEEEVFLLHASYFAKTLASSWDSKLLADYSEELLELSIDYLNTSDVP